MNGNEMAKLLLIGSLLLFFLQLPSTAEAAKLRYIRIGEHETFTRVVFEFHGSVRFKDPVIKDKGNLSVVFLDTTTTLPQSIPADTTNRVDAIEFIQQESHLTAQITFPFPYFSLKTFSLANPERVVLDLRQTSAPPKGVAFQKPVAEEPPQKGVTPPAKKEPPAETQGPPAEEASERVEEPAEISSKPSSKDTRQEAERIPEETEEQGRVRAGAQEMEVAQRATQVPDTGAESLPPSPKQGLLQTYLLVSLVVLSVMIIVLLAFMLFKRMRGPESIQLVGKSDELLKAEKTIAAIDAKIKKQLEEYDDQS
jgi:hypothetical protein